MEKGNKMYEITNSNKNEGLAGIMWILFFAIICSILIFLMFESADQLIVSWIWIAFIGCMALSILPFSVITYRTYILVYENGILIQRLRKKYYPYHEIASYKLKKKKYGHYLYIILQNKHKRRIAATNLGTAKFIHNFQNKDNSDDSKIKFLLGDTIHTITIQLEIKDNNLDMYKQFFKINSENMKNFRDDIPQFLEILTKEIEKKLIYAFSNST